MKKKRSRGQEVLRILFREVLEIMPAEEADKLADGHRAGQNICLIVGESSHGKYCKTAFDWEITDSQKWRHLPETTGTIH